MLISIFSLSRIIKVNILTNRFLNKANYRNLGFIIRYLFIPIWFRNFKASKND